MFFTYDPEGAGFEIHDTWEQARNAAIDALDAVREEAAAQGEWPDEADFSRISWGEIKEAVTRTREEPAPEGSRHETVLDYDLRPVHPAPAIYPMYCIGCLKRWGKRVITGYSTIPDSSGTCCECVEQLRREAGLRGRGTS